MNPIPLKLFMKESFIKNLNWYFSLIMIVVLSTVINTNTNSSSQIPTAAEVLSKAAKSESTINYVGKRIVIRWHPPGTTAFEERVIHQAPATHLMELLTPVDRIGFERRPGRDDRQGNKEQSRWKKDKRGGWYRMRRMSPPPPEMRNLRNIWQANTQLLLRNYKVDVAISEPIAGQNTYLLTINPKVTSRPKKKIWLDVQHHIILRMEDYDIAGELGSLSVYTTIDYDSASVARQLERYQKGHQSEKERRSNFNIEEIEFAEAEKRFGTKLPQPTYLPIGFQLDSTSVLMFRDNPSIHFRYTDGLTALSLFVSKIDNERKDKQHWSGQEDRFRERREWDNKSGDRRGRRDRFKGGNLTTVTVGDTSISIVDRGHIRILQWKMNGQSEQKKIHFVLMGELGQEEMLKVAETLVSQE